MKIKSNRVLCLDVWQRYKCCVKIPIELWSSCGSLVVVYKDINVLLKSLLNYEDLVVVWWLFIVMEKHQLVMSLNMIGILLNWSNGLHICSHNIS